jgi:hypothetical protein
MPRLTTIRNCTFVLFCLVTAFAFEERLLAAMGDSLKSACQGWENGDGYDCTACARGIGYPDPDWEAEGYCDFSGAQNDDPEFLGAAYCEGIMLGLDSTCESEYPEYLASWSSWAMSTNDPCYRAATDPQCWITWANGSCDAGAYSTWSGSCDRFMWCECDS